MAPVYCHARFSCAKNFAQGAKKVLKKIFEKKLTQFKTQKNIPPKIACGQNLHFFTGDEEDGREARPGQAGGGGGLEEAGRAKAVSTNTIKSILPDKSGG